MSKWGGGWIIPFYYPIFGGLILNLFWMATILKDWNGKDHRTGKPDLKGIYLFIRMFLI